MGVFLPFTLYVASGLNPVFKYDRRFAVCPRAEEQRKLRLPLQPPGRGLCPLPIRIKSTN